MQLGNLGEYVKLNQQLFDFIFDFNIYDYGLIMRCQRTLSQVLVTGCVRLILLKKIISYYEQLLTQSINPAASNFSQNRSISILR